MTDPAPPIPDDATRLIQDAIIQTGGAGGWVPPGPQELTGLPNLEVIALIGRGGMGAVYRARQTHLDRHVALKILSPERSADPAFVERFEREARALARLNHPHIVILHDFGRAGPWCYLVLELVEGATLRQVMQTGRLSADEALRLAPQLCDALAHAHAAGVVHRDLKPENILIDGRGRAKIADFGLAKLRDPGAVGLTASGAALGTLHYMAPEQIEGAAGVDHRADLYALGVILYELLTGGLPLGRFAPPSQSSGSDARLDEVVMRSLEREPAKRWQSAEEVQRAVERIAAPSRGTGSLGGDALARRELRHRQRQERDDEKRRETAEHGERRLHRGGLTLLVLGVLWLVILVEQDWYRVVNWPDVALRDRLALAAWIAAPLALAGGVATLLRVGLPLAVLGALAAWVAVLQAWQSGWWPALLTLMPVLFTTPLLNHRRLIRHFAGPWNWRPVLGTTVAMVVAVAIGVLAVVPMVQASKRQQQAIAHEESLTLGFRLFLAHDFLRSTLAKHPQAPANTDRAIERTRLPFERLLRWCGQEPPRDEDLPPMADNVLAAVAAIEAEMPAIRAAVAIVDTHWLRRMSSACDRLAGLLAILHFDPAQPVTLTNGEWMRQAFEAINRGTRNAISDDLRPRLTPTTWLSTAQARSLLIRFRDPKERRDAGELLRPHIVDPAGYDLMVTAVLPVGQ